MFRKICMILIAIMITFDLISINEIIFSEKIEIKEVWLLLFFFSLIITILMIIIYLNSGCSIDSSYLCCKIAYVEKSYYNKYIVVYFLPDIKSPTGYKIKKSILKEGTFNSLNIIAEAYNLTSGRKVDIFTNIYNEIIKINYYN